MTDNQKPSKCSMTVEVDSAMDVKFAELLKAVEAHVGTRIVSSIREYCAIKQAENERLRDALEPFVALDTDCLERQMGNDAESCFLWKPTSNYRCTHGISLQHIRDAKEAAK